MQSTQVASHAMKRRTDITFACFLMLVVLLVARLAWIQWWQSGHFQHIAGKLHNRPIPAPAQRGEILASDDNELASNVAARDICANPRVIADAEETARA